MLSVLLPLDVLEGSHALRLQINVEADKMAEEKDGRGVQDESNRNYYVILSNHGLLIELDISPYRLLLPPIIKCQHSCIHTVMQHSHNEHRAYEFEELLVIGVPYAVVEPPAVVVKPAHAPVARPTVLRVIFHIGLADLAVELEVLAVEGLVEGFMLVLDCNGWIRRVRLSGCVPIVDYRQENEGVDQAKDTASCRREGEGNHADEVEGVGV